MQIEIMDWVAFSVVSSTCVKDIRYVFLTHAHDDHAGFLNEVLALMDGIRLYPL